MDFLENISSNLCPQDTSCLFQITNELRIGNQAILTSWAFFSLSKAEKLIFKKEKWKWSM